MRVRLRFAQTVRKARASSPLGLALHRSRARAQPNGALSRRAIATSALVSTPQASGGAPNKQVKRALRLRRSLNNAQKTYAGALAF